MLLTAGGAPEGNLAVCVCSRAEMGPEGSSALLNSVMSALLASSGGSISPCEMGSKGLVDWPAPSERTKDA